MLNLNLVEKEVKIENIADVDPLFILPRNKSGMKTRDEHLCWMNGQEDLLNRLTSIYIVSGSSKSGSK